MADRKEARRKLVSDTERKQRKLTREIGPVSFEFDPPDRETLRRVMGAKSAQYRRTALADRFAEPWVVQLIDDLSETRTEDFRLIVPTLRAGGQWVAGNIMLRYRGTLSGWFPAYKPGCARFSPGMAHRLRCLESAAAEGVLRVELGREGQTHKERWATDEQILLEGAIELPSIAAFLRRAQREPVRALRELVVKNPRLYRAGRRLLSRRRETMITNQSRRSSTAATRSAERPSSQDDAHRGSERLGCRPGRR